MDIDLWHLPIPDWELSCPGCRYALCGLPSHRCPECGLELDMPALVKTWTRLREPRWTGRELPIPDYGLTCSGCDDDLEGWESFACRGCGRVVSLEKFRPTATWFAIEPAMTGALLLPLIEGLLADQLIPFLTRDDKSLADIFFGGRTIGTKVLVASEFYFEFRCLMRREQRRVEAGRKIIGSERWRCPKCGSRVPGNFEVCWKCGD